MPPQASLIIWLMAFLILILGLGEDRPKAKRDTNLTTVEKTSYEH